LHGSADDVGADSSPERSAWQLSFVGALALDLQISPGRIDVRKVRQVPPVAVYVDLTIYDTLASRRAREPLAADCMHALGSESLDAHGGNASASMLFRTQGVHGSTGLVAQAVTNLADVPIAQRIPTPSSGGGGIGGGGIVGIVVGVLAGVGALVGGGYFAWKKTKGGRARTAYASHIDVSVQPMTSVATTATRPPAGLVAGAVVGGGTEGYAPPLASDGPVTSPLSCGSVPLSSNA